MLKGWNRSRQPPTALNQHGVSLAEEGRLHYQTKMAQAGECHGTIPAYAAVAADLPQDDFRPPDAHKVFAAIRATATRKAAGVDGLPAEVFKAGGFGAAEMVQFLVSKCCELRGVPEEWGHGLVCPLYKGKGDPSDLNNRRPVTILPVVRKIAERTLLADVQSSLARSQSSKVVSGRDEELWISAWLWTVSWPQRSGLWRFLTFRRPTTVSARTCCGGSAWTEDYARHCSRSAVPCAPMAAPRC